MLNLSTKRCSLLIVDDQPSVLATLQVLLGDEFEVYTAQNAESAQRAVEQKNIQIILTDQKMPGMSGVQLLEWVRQRSPQTIRLMMTGVADLEEAVEAINRGEVFRYLFKPWKHDQLLRMLREAVHTFCLENQNTLLLQETRRLNDELRKVNAELEQRVAQRTRELQEANQGLEKKNKVLEKLALTDPLTSLPNRRAMDRLAEREIRRRERYPNQLAIAIIDVDQFKSINDRFLLPGGDKVLVELGRVLSASIRTVDFVGRIGGEEFMVIAPETGTEGAVTLGERIRTNVENGVFRYRDDVIPVRVSIGFALAGDAIEVDLDTMRTAASEALSEAKKTGRNRCVFYALTGEEVTKVDVSAIPVSVG